ncbi:MAG: PAS domain S-box protein [Methanospirillum sp.]|uniref:CHASE4 domain-containing protein n=1 Tax=Methanospirillum sp. TaxID=45200 RepID=UPI002375B313|nr:CHASE4 domain-containing protein [Methanospirillum sp.]MDD1729088.1 PAS domain S-box protein [Methanospirillum sp.]
MRLQKVSILVFFTLLSVFLLIISLFFSTILLTSYRELEERYIENDLDQAVNKLNDELFTMSSIASDWGPWDDTVEFINGNDPNYLNSNLQPYGFDNLNLNIMAFANASGEIVFSGSYDLQNRVMIPVPGFFAERISHSNPLMNMSDFHHVTRGILMLPENPLLIVSQPIVYSNYTGPARGVVIMGRYLNEEEISRLATLTQPSLSLTRITDPSLSPDLISGLTQMSNPVPKVISAKNADYVAGYALIRDLYGDDALVLQITEYRNIYHQGINTTIQVILIILIGGFSLGLIVIVLLNRVILRRIASLASQVHSIGQSGSTTDHVVILGDDELSGLAGEINQMLETIEHTQKKVQTSEAQFRDLVEKLPDYILVFGDANEILYINQAASKGLGYVVDSIADMPVRVSDGTTVQDQTISRVAAELCDTTEMPINELEIQVQDGNWISVLVKGTKILYNNSSAILLLLIDITQRKQLEKERDLHEKELEQYSLSLHQANTKLRLLTGLTRHDVQNKLTSMQSFHTLAKDEPDIGITQEYIAYAQQAGRKLEAIIAFTREYEDFGIISSGWQPVHSIVELALAEIPLGSIIIENQIAEELEIYADPIIRKVFSTLMDNSIRHGERVTGVQFSCVIEDTQLLIIYEDNGVGVQYEEKKYIFEHGYGKHTGLGLFLAKEILSITGLSIRECGEPGKGARFEIQVPIGAFRFK